MASVWKQLYDRGYIKVKNRKPSYTKKGKRMVRDFTKRRYEKGEITQSEMLETVSKISFPTVTTTEKPRKPTVYEILTSGTTQAIKDTTTGNILGYLGKGNTITDIHGTTIGTYKGPKDISLETLTPVPKRPGIPYCEERNYEKAQEYLRDLQEEGKVPGGVSLVQTPEGWKYKMPEAKKAWVKLDTGERVLHEGYAKLDKPAQDYLNKYGIAGFNKGYIPAQIWLAEATEKKRRETIGKLKPYFVESKVPEGIVNPVFVKFIKGLSGYNLIQIMKDKALSDKDLKSIFGSKAVDNARAICEAEPVAWQTIGQSKPLTTFQKKYPEYWDAVTARGGRFWVGTGGMLHFDFFEDGKRVKGAIPEGKIQRGIRETMLEKGYKIPTPQEFNTFEYDVNQWGWSLPAEHPIKSARVGLIITEAAIIGAIAAPAIWAGVGWVGRTLTPAILSRVAVGRVSVAVIPKIATMLAQYTAVTTPVAITGATITESLRHTDIDHKWEVFQALPTNTQNYWAKQSGYEVRFDSLSEAQKANVLLHYSVPTGYTLAQWSTTLGEYSEELLEYSGKGADWLRERVHWRVAEPIIFAGGCVAGVTLGVGYMAQLPLIAGQLTYEIPKGTAEDFSKVVLLGMVTFFTTEIPKMVKADPSLGTGVIVGLFILSPGGLLKFAKGQGVRLHPRYVPERGMAIEANSLRVGLDQVAWAKLTQKQKLTVMNTLTRELMTSGKDTVEIKLYGSKWTMEVLNVPYQRIVKNTTWAATPDITKFGGTVRVGKMKLYPSAELAIRFMLSTSKGRAGKHPGVIEIHTSPKDAAYKLLGKGEGELEMPLQYKTLDAIKGFGGKGVSSNAYVGIYPIRRYTIRGEGFKDWKGPTGKELAEVRVLAAKEGAIDTLVGWHHRWKTLKQIFAKDPRVKKLDASIKQVKSEQPEFTKILANGEHQILRQRRGIPHPVSGTIKPRVKGVITRADGRVMLVKDRAGKAYELPGGSVDVKDIIIRGKFKHPETATWEQALASQVMGETMVGLKNIKYLDLYLGKVNEHAFSGARIFEATAVGKADRVKAWHKYQRAKYGYTEPELASIEWWKLGDKGIEVLPSTIDILKARMSTEGLRLYTASKTLNKARDTKFADRVKRGKLVNEADIKKMNEVELKSLRDELNKLLKGEPIEVRDLFESGEDFALLLEVIKGRRNAIKYIRDGRISISEIRMMHKHPELFSQKAWKIIDSLVTKKRKMTTKERSVLNKDLEKSFNDYMKWENERLGKVKDDYEATAYRENEGYYNRAYSRHFYELARPMVAAIGYAGRAIYQEEPEIAARYAAILKRDRTIPVATVRRIIPPRVRIPPRVPPRRIPPPPAIPVPPRVPRPPRVPPPPVSVPKPPIPRVLPPKDVISRLTKKQREGIIAWKQGWCYKLIYPPYGVDNIVNSRKPLAGVKYYKGPRSASKSIIAKLGYVPPEVLRDMGIMDVIIRTPWQKGKKPKIYFKRDIKQRTRTTPGISGVR